MLIDTTFDFRTDATTNDPDQSSPTLRRCHQRLWSKPLPSGHPFDLDTTTPDSYLHHNSDLGEFFLGSDSVIATYSYWQSTAELISQIPIVQVEQFDTIGSTIGGIVVFPNNMVDGKPTINMARGMHRRTIADRMDLTLERIRRYHAWTPTFPLAPPWPDIRSSSPSSATSAGTSTSSCCRTSFPATTRGCSSSRPSTTSPPQPCLAISPPTHNSARRRSSSSSLATGASQSGRRQHLEG